MKVVIFLLMSLFACDPVSKSPQDRVPTGVWGGKGVKLTVLADGAQVDYGCDSGSMEKRLRTDSSGKFVAVGTHIFGSGGPRNPGDSAPKPHRARFEGSRDGDTLRFTVTLPELNRKLGDFTVTLGQQATLERCG